MLIFKSIPVVLEQQREEEIAMPPALHPEDVAEEPQRPVAEVAPPEGTNAP
ncbi:UNVERIFIED_CONTAM: hypothetical protein FKN15_056867 [Acipenser sinensis]